MASVPSCIILQRDGKTHRQGRHFFSSFRHLAEWESIFSINSFQRFLRYLIIVRTLLSIFCTINMFIWFGLLYDDVSRCWHNCNSIGDDVHMITRNGLLYYTEDADMITRWRSHLSAAVLSILHHHRELEIILRLRLNPGFVLKIWNLVFVLKCFLQPYFCKVLLFVLKCFIQSFFIKFHWTQHVFENTFKSDNDATLPVWKKEKSSKTDARTVCNCNFKNNLCTLTMCIFVGQQFAAMRGTSMFPPVGCLAFPSHTNRGSRPALCTGRCYVST